MSADPRPHFRSERPDEFRIALLRAMPKPERLMRTLALSAFVRGMSHAGAVRHSGSLGQDAVRQRFLEQLFGAPLPEHLRRLIARL